MTYSIVAVDRPTGALGAPVQSHWFSVGAIVPRNDGARPGAGGYAALAALVLAGGWLDWVG